MDLAFRPTQTRRPHASRAHATRSGVCARGAARSRRPIAHSRPRNCRNSGRRGWLAMPLAGEPAGRARRARLRARDRASSRAPAPRSACCLASTIAVVSSMRSSGSRRRRPARGGCRPSRAARCSARSRSPTLGRRIPARRARGGAARWRPDPSSTAMKAFVPGAAGADCLPRLRRSPTRRGRPPRPRSLLLVPRDTPGFTVGRARSAGGRAGLGRRRPSISTDVIFPRRPCCSGDGRALGRDLLAAAGSRRRRAGRRDRDGGDGRAVGDAPTSATRPEPWSEAARECSS